MKKFKVGILEDSKTLLKQLKLDLEATNLVEVLLWASNSNDFLEFKNIKDVDIILLDIELGNDDNMTGIDVANFLKKPTIFVSGKTGEKIKEIEEIDLNNTFPISHITKPITLEKLNKKLPQFFESFNNYFSDKFAYLDFDGSKRNKINLNSIVFLETDSNSSPKNKIVYFTDRKPKILKNFSFKSMENYGLRNEIFENYHNSYRVNKKHIIRYNKDDFTITLRARNENGSLIDKNLKVSENNRHLFR